MGIITSQVTQDEYSIQDDIWVYAESDQLTSTDFRFIVDVIYDGDLLIRYKVYPKPESSYSYLYLNINRVLQSVFDYSKRLFRDNSYVWALSYYQRPGLDSTIEIQIGEEIGGVATLNEARHEPIYYNFTPQHLKRYTDIYALMPFSRACFLTTRPLIHKAYIEDFITLPYWGLTEEQDTHTLFVEMYDENNSMYFNAQYDELNKLPLIQCNISPFHIEFLTGTSIQSWYRVRIYDKAVDTFTEWFEVHIDRCKKYDAVNLTFLNRFGVYDTARFSLVRKEIVDTERKSFTKNEIYFGTNYWYSGKVNYSYDRFSDYNTYTIHNESKINFSQKIDETYKLIMDYPTDAEFEWLKDLFNSPQILFSFTGMNPTFYPVTIKNSNYEVFKNHYAGLKTLELEIEFNQRRNGFRR